jgi:hypothetical protein
MAKSLIWELKDIYDILLQWQLNEFDGLVVFSGRRGLGKCFNYGVVTLMANGEWKQVQDIVVGDKVVSPQEDGSYTIETVEEVHSHDDTIFEVREVTRDKKLLYKCSSNHEIPIYRAYCPRVLDKDGKTTNKREYHYILDCYEAERLSKIKNTKGSHYCSFTTSAIGFDKPDSTIDPYCLGTWLGDGHFTDQAGITMGDIKKEIVEYFKEKNYIMSENKDNRNNCVNYRFSMGCEFTKELIRLGLRNKQSGDKFIPKECLLSSIPYRFQLLAGLIDTDGYVMKTKDNCIVYTTKSKQLANDIYNLVHSLGGHAKVRPITKKCQNNFQGDYYNVKISFLDPKVIPLKTIKKERLGNVMKHDPRHVAIEVINTHKIEKVYGFSITGKSKWYVTDNWMVTHNSTSAVKLASKFRGFNFEKNILFQRDEIMEFLDKSKYSVMVADEMINVTYNRDFYSQEQKKLLKMINMYRDNCNILLACVPSFYDLDKQFRNLCKLRIDVIRRGLGVIHMPLQSMFMQDKWDTDNNAKIEKSFFNNRGEFRPQYKRLTTFQGFLKLEQLTDRQKQVYKELKERKRNLVYLNGEDDSKKELKDLDASNKKFLYKKMVEAIIENPINQKHEFITMQSSILGVSEESVRRNLNTELALKGYRLTDFIKKK